jgi:hypothetical protein
MSDDTEHDEPHEEKNQPEEEIVLSEPQTLEDLPSMPSPAAQIAFSDYLTLGSMRSIAALRNSYVDKLKKDPTYPVPTTNLYLLSMWEARYNWKALSWEHDADSNRAYQESRKSLLSTLYTSHGNRAQKLLRIAEKAIDQLEAEIDAGQTVLSPQDALKFMQEGAKAAREAQEALLKLQDPSEQSDQGGSDFFDSIRKMGLLQINQNNYYGGQ